MMKQRKVKKVAVIVEGMNWGDEGKGKIAAREAKNAKLVIRATGGANAGHTVAWNGKKIGLHLVPGGIVYPQTMCLIGQGVVIDFPILFKEIRDLREMGVPNVVKRLKISGRAHVLFPYHKELDELHERMKENPIGTTKRGIGPCYADKDNRVGIRVYDLLLPVNELEKKIQEAVKLHNQDFAANGMEYAVVNPKKLAIQYSKCGEILKKHDMVVNADALTEKTISRGQKIVVEGAQAYRLDKDYGDYPMVTSSNCATAGTLVGAHLPYNAVKTVIGITKAHASRVGNGVFPTEQPAHIENDKVVPYSIPCIGDVIREEAHEFGVSTGRPRRTGWHDGILSKSAKHALGLDYQCINHVDTIGEIGNKVGHIKVCVGYIYCGKIIDYYPDDMNLTGRTPQPMYMIVNGGWHLTGKERFYWQLPKKAREFIKLIEDISGVPVKYIGVGPDNDDLVVRHFI